MSAQYAVPAPPRVTSPSPTPSEPSSTSNRQNVRSPPAVVEENKENGGGDSDSSTELRARTRSRSPKSSNQVRRRVAPLTPARSSKPETSSKDETSANGTPVVNGHLAPYSSLQDRFRGLSRSPSPLGLIPLHKHYRSFIHRHEIPRKLLHVSIGFFTLGLYRSGVQTHSIPPFILSGLLPITVVEFMRHRSETVNKFYVRCLGALMRETEVKGYNGVIWYMLGACVALKLFSKDVGVMSILLLSWCDTAASTFGRMWGRYTMRLRRGKSLAGALAAWTVGAVTAATFWGWFVPRMGSFPGDPEGAHMFTGTLNFIPGFFSNLLERVGIHNASASVTGPAALGIMSVWTGIVAAGSEMVDLFGWDDNLTIPVLSGVGIWGFLKVFG